MELEKAFKLQKVLRAGEANCLNSPNVIGVFLAIRQKSPKIKKTQHIPIPAVKEIKTSA